MENLMGTGIETYALSNEAGLQVLVTNAGAAVMEIKLPDREKGELDVLLGTERAVDRLSPGPMFGAVLGRTAGRIKDGAYDYGGERIQLALNRQTYHCHGGFKGFDKRIFTLEELGKDTVTFTYTAKDGEEGYPGSFTLHVTYRLVGKKLRVEHRGCGDKDTIVSISNHMYFNLNGQGGQEVLNHYVWIPAGRLSVPDAECFDTGKTMDIAGTAFDFTAPHRIGERMGEDDPLLRLMNGYDHNYVLSDHRPDTPCAGVYSPLTGHSLTLYTDLPAMQLYVADFTGLCMQGKRNAVYNGRDGFCLETQFVPNAMNTQSLWKPILRAGEEYYHFTEFSFDEDRWRQGMKSPEYI